LFFPSDHLFINVVTAFMAMIHWKNLLVEGPTTEKIRNLGDDTGTPDAAWLAWGKLVRKRTQHLDLARYRAALSWCDPLTVSQGDAKATLLAMSQLPELTETQTPQQWTEQWLKLEKTLNDLVRKPRFAIEHQPLSHQMHCAEIPWLIGCLFPDLTAGQRMLQLARENFRLGLAEIFDGSGLPHAANVLFLRPLLASWTRALMVGKKAKLRPWPIADHHQFEWAVLHALRLMRGDGSPVFDESHASPELAMMQHALAFDTDEADHAVARVLFPRRFSLNGIAKIRAALTQKPQATQKATKPAAAVKAAEPIALPDATYFSEWAQTAVLRSGWHFREPSLAVAFAPINRLAQPDRSQDDVQRAWSDQSVAVELNLAGQTIWSGNWDVAVRIDGRTLFPTDTWSTTCEIAEESGCYLEIELPLTENMRLQRHFLLCHKEKLLLLADAVLPQYEDNIDFGIEHLGFDDARYAIDYESQLPLVPGTGVKSSAEMTELLLTVPGVGNRASTSRERERAAGKSIRVFPLALPEWKTAWTSDAEKPADFVSGELACAGQNDRQGLILRQHAWGRALFAPMLFDLDAKRIKQPYTWRQLTVGENLERVARDRAIAFRLQIDKMHLLLYRTMTSALNRTFFGHNLVSDFFAGRFDAKTGKVSTIVEAE